MIDVLCMRIFSYGVSRKNIFIRRGPLYCSFYYTGQCEGLNEWKEHKIQTLTLFSYQCGP